MDLDRRALLGAGAALGCAQQTPPAAAQIDASAPPVTASLARYLVEAKPSDIPEPVRREGRRSLLNYVGVAVGGSRHETVARAITALAPFAGKPEANLLGRPERFDILQATLINGISSHIFDYDDTHLKTIIHPAGPVVSAALALAQHRPVTGAEFLHAIILGIETECRIGNAVYPSHYAMGWHITGSCGVFGSAAACGSVRSVSIRRIHSAISASAGCVVSTASRFTASTMRSKSRSSASKFSSTIGSIEGSIEASFK